MVTSAIERLRGIKTLPQLLAYLRDELDWPIGSADVDDVTFEYSREELGLDPKHVAGVKEIKQLRPLSSNQPWGIFFVNFEKKRLPVTVMRVILAALQIKKRTPAAKSERQAWESQDLLFISAYGAEGDRALTFAHFVPTGETTRAAELRVLGWDDDDTPLKYDYVASVLHDKLRWREEFVRDPAKWRSQWNDAFVVRHRQVITTSKQLALALAGAAKKIRARVRSLLKLEDGLGEMRRLLRAFQTALIHDLDDDDFADMVAQTITYGLFSVSVRRTFPGEGTAVTREDIPHFIFTSPFLKEMMTTFLGLKSRKGKIDFDRLGIADVTDLLQSRDTQMERILDDFNNRNPQEDPVIHFYELFLGEYDRQKKIQRGVFYTPQPVVAYIVHSVHELLQTELGLINGLADTTTWGEMLKKHPRLKLPPLTDEPGEKRTISPDEPFVQILDPATGTATFLVEVIHKIYTHLKAEWNEGGLGAVPRLASESRVAAGNRKGSSSAASLPPSTFLTYWNGYVPQHLLPRLHAFELMMAPYAIAHMKIGLKLAETGYRFGAEERARIYLTNALEPWVKQLPLIGFDALAHEAAAVNEIKRHKRFTVVIGNPPYSINSCNLQESAVALVEPFRYVDGEKIQERGALKFETILQDDYVKFWGLGVRILQHTPRGIIGMISNNGFLTNRVLRGVRKTFLNTFNRCTFFDLHGNRSKGEVCPDGSADDNVFDINQGVAISILRNANTPASKSEVELANLWGKRSLKYRTLASSSVSTTTFHSHLPKSPYYAFALVDAGTEDEYRAFVALDEAMPFNRAGFVSGRDDFAVDFDLEPLQQRIDDFLNPKNSDSVIRERYSIKDAGGYILAKRRQPALAARLKAKNIIRRVQQRPFDYRFVAYSEAVLTSPQKAAMNQLAVGDNLAFCLSRGAEIIRGWEHIFCTRALAQHHTVSLKEVNYVFPLSVRVENDSFTFGNAKAPNFAPQFVKAFAERLNLDIDRTSEWSNGLTPEDIFYYAYAVFHSPGYRSRYAEFLKIDFPRLPLTRNLELFRALAKLGGELVALHLLESSKLDKPRAEFIGGRNPEVEKVSWSNSTVWIDKARTIGFRGVPGEGWNFHIGGYQVCEKWLKDRKGRTLSKNDIAHYHKIVIALSETIHLMSEIDKVIERHGGWPGAFAPETTLKKQ